MPLFALTVPRSCATTREWRWRGPSTCSAMRHLRRRPPIARTRSELAVELLGGGLGVGEGRPDSALTTTALPACLLPTEPCFTIATALPSCCSLGAVANEAFCTAVSKWTFQVRLHCAVVACKAKGRPPAACMHSCSSGLMLDAEEKHSCWAPGCVPCVPLVASVLNYCLPGRLLSPAGARRAAGQQPEPPRGVGRAPGWGEAGAVPHQ